MDIGRIRFATLLACAVLAMPLESRAQDELPVPADEFVFCTVCHGVQVMGNPVLEAPRLSGMEDWYVERQMHAFKNGWRGTHENDPIGMEMQPMAVALSDRQIAEVAEFVQSTRSPLPPSTIDGDVDKGRTLYQTCATCHGRNAEGNASLGGPALTGIDDWYQVTQLKNYKSGARGNNPQDTYGIQMAAATQLLADDDAIMDVVKYITTLKTDQKP